MIKPKNIKTIFKEGSEIEYCQLYWVHRFQPCHNQICYQIQRIIFQGKIGSTLSVVLGAPPEEEKWIGKSLKTELHIVSGKSLKTQFYWKVVENRSKPDILH